MVEEGQAVAEVSKRRRGMVAALVAILLVSATIVGLAYVMEIGPFAPADTEPAVDQDSTKPSEEDTATGSPALSLPPVEAQEAMFWEQMASEVTIQELVDDKFAAFELSEVSANDGVANIRVKAVYRDTASISGWMVMREYSENWFLASITRDGSPMVTPVSGPADAAVAQAIAEGCAANQEIPGVILEGGYTLITVEKVTKGSGTAMIDVTFSGGTAAATKGQITCISKDIGGTKHWFVTGFTKS